jgi:hypothetical protein
MPAIRTRLRFAVTAVLLALTGLLLGAGVAAADDYVPTPVTDPAIAPPVVVTAPSDGGSLAYTGVGMNVGLTVGIAIAVLVVGGLLIFLGTRMSRRRG